MISDAEGAEKNVGSTADFVAGTQWRTANLHNQALGKMSLEGFVPDVIDSLGKPVTAEVIEMVNSDEATADSPIEIIGPA